MKKKGGLSLAVLAAAALLVLGCQPFANIGGKPHPGGQHYIKLAINVPERGRTISVTDYEVTRLSIEVRDPDNEVVDTIPWEPSEGDVTHMIPVDKTGEYAITVTHYGEQNGQTVEASETATFTIGAMLITVIEVVPGNIATINVVGGTTNATSTLSGKLVDSGTGAPLAGGTVDFAGHSATSGTDGSYSLDLGQSTGTVTGTLCVHATGFVTNLFEGISVDANATARWVLQRIDNTGLPGHDVNLHIYELQSNPSTPTEIPDGTPIFVSLFNENGAGGRDWKTYNDGGYQYYNHVSGDSCVLAVYVDLSAVPGMHSFNVIKENVSVPAASQDIPDVVLNENPDSEATMTISGAAALNNATLYLAFPNGLFPALDLTLDSSAQATLLFSNPAAYKGFWVQSFDSTVFACSPLAPVATSVTLPAMPSLGPLLPPDSSSLAYESGTLSVSPVDGAMGYNFWLLDTSYNLVGIIGGVGPSVTLPAWMQAQLAGASLVVMPVASASTMPSIDISALSTMLIYAGAAPSVATLLAQGSPNTLSF